MLKTLFLMMGGIGSRFGRDLPKQFTIVNEKPIFMYILAAYDSLPFIDRIVIVTNKNWVDLTNTYLSSFSNNKPISVVIGGDSRSESIKNGIIASQPFSSPDDFILIHDTTHPYVDGESIQHAIEYMDSYDGVTLCQREYDTCYSIKDDIVVSEIPKTSVVSGASPEIFRYRDLFEMYINTTPEKLQSFSSAGAMAIRNGLKIKVVPMSYLNIKITLPGDMDLFTELCSNYYFRRRVNVRLYT